MRFVLSLNAQVLRWMTVLVSIAIFASSQNAPSTARNGNQFYRVQLSTGQVVADTFVGTHLQGAATLVSEGAAGWVLVGVGDFRHNGDKGLVYSESSTGALAVIFYGGPDGTILRDFSSLAAPGAGWTARTVADLNGDGHPDVIFVNKTTGQVDVYFYGGLQRRARAEGAAAPSREALLAQLDQLSADDLQTLLKRVLDGKQSA